MIFIPINTDAPLYHFPYATIGLIAINTICFAATGFAMNDRLLDPWLLEYGNGINPLEWIPAAFAHGGFMHLIGNMFFLWGFGLVVEGKLGWRVFVPLYLAMAAGWGAGVDVLTLHRTDAYVLRNELELESREQLVQLLSSDGGDFEDEDAEPLPVADSAAERQADEILSMAKGRCLGASGVIFALMAISLVWAPKNEMHVVGFMFYRPFSVEVTIMFFSLGFLIMNLVEFAIFPGMGSPGLHLVGCAIGFPVGILFLKRHWVDCENWDLFAVLSGKYGRFAEPDWALGAHGNPNNFLKEIPVPVEDAQPKTEETARLRRRKQQLSDVNSFIDAGDFLAAAEELVSLRLEDSDLCPDASRTKKLAIGLLQTEAWDEAEIWLQEFIDRYPEDNRWARVRMAQLLVVQLGRPNAALTYLKGLQVEGMSEQLLTLARKISKTAKEQIRNGAVDREHEW